MMIPLVFLVDIVINRKVVGTLFSMAAVQEKRIIYPNPMHFFLHALHSNLLAN